LTFRADLIIVRAARMSIEQGGVMRMAKLVFGSIVVALAGLAVAHPTPAAGPRRDDHTVSRMCAQQGGTLSGPNAVFDTDTTGMTDAGYFCFFYSPASASAHPEVPADHLFTAAMLTADPQTNRITALCAAARGTFYFFEESFVGETVDAGWGCKWLP
jgi:hypothetical protein